MSTYTIPTESGQPGVYDDVTGLVTVGGVTRALSAAEARIFNASAAARANATAAAAFAVNESGILAKLVAAIGANDQTLTDMDAIVATVNTFLAITAPSTAQRNAFIADMGRAVRTIATDQKKQTRQLTALARLAIRDLSSTAGT